MSFPMILALKVLLLALLFAASAFFSGAETALFSLDAMQMQSIRKAGGFRARLVGLAAKPAKLLSTILIGNTIVNALIAVLGYSIAESIEPLRKYSEIVSIFAMTLALLLFGEIAPKRMAVRHPVKFTSVIAPALYAVHVLLSPLNYLFSLFSGALEKHLKPERRSLSDEELMTAIELSAEEGAIDTDLRNMADGIMQLSQMTAADVMTPRVDFFGIDLDEPEESFPALIRSTEFHYLPVYRNTPDAIEGFLDVRSYLLDPAHEFKKALKKPVFLPETASLDDILITMQRSRRHIVCIMDEYGGTAGLVTRGDVLEILTGEIPDDSTEKLEENIIEKSERVWTIAGDTSLEEINHALDLDLDTDGADRISGWVAAQAGRFLRSGESVIAQGCRVKVLKHKKLRILLVELEKLEEKAGEEDEYLEEEQ